MQLVSDVILEEVAQAAPTFQAIFPSFGNFDLGSPAAFTEGQPFDYFKLLRERAAVSWSNTETTKGIHSTKQCEFIMEDF